jgi:hypothetical protein
MGRHYAFHQSQTNDPEVLARTKKSAEAGSAPREAAPLTTLNFGALPPAQQRASAVQLSRVAGNRATADLLQRCTACGEEEAVQRSFFDDIAGGVSNLAGQAGSAVSGAVGSAANYGQGVINDAAGGLGGLANSAGGAVSGLINQGTNAAQGAVNSAANAAGGAASSTLSQGANWLGGQVSGMGAGTPFANLSGIAGNAISEGGAEVGNLANQGIGAAGNVASQSVGSAGNIANNLVGSGVSATNEALNTGANVAGGALNTGANIAQNIAGAGVEQVQNTANLAAGAANTVGGLFDKLF